MLLSRIKGGLLTSTFTEAVTRLVRLMSTWHTYSPPSLSRRSRICKRKNMLIEAWNGSIYRWHGVSLWWKCLSTPFIYTLFYIIYIIYTFGYFTHTDYTHSLPCVLFIICVLCVFYDSIHVLNVLFFSEPYLVLFIIKVSKQVYKVLWWSRIFQLKINESRGPGERVSGECGGNHTTDWLRAICR